MVPNLEAVLMGWRDVGRPAVPLSASPSPGWGCPSSLAGTLTSPHPTLTQPVGPHHPHASRIRWDGRMAGPSSPAGCPPSPHLLGVPAPGVQSLLHPHLGVLWVFSQTEAKSPSWKLGKEKGKLMARIPCPGVTWLTTVGSDPEVQTCELERTRWREL